MNGMTILQLQDTYLLNTYSARLVLTEGNGCTVKDVDGKEYLDFTSGISVCNVGHCHPTVTQAISEQAGKLVHVSNLYVNELQPQLAAEISTRSFNGRVFFANSGAEANEGMIKFARKWGSDKGRFEIVCMHHNFHGRTIGALSATDKDAIRQGFEPLCDGFKFVDYNDLEALDAGLLPFALFDLQQVIAGRLNPLATHRVDVGGKLDQALHAASDLEFPVALAALASREWVFLAACRGGSTPQPDESAWTLERLRRAAREVWQSWREK